MRGARSMDRLEAVLSVIDYSLNTRRKRHIAGGILMSVALLFGGLAVTVMSLKTEEKLCITE
jgi:hypothetical protein